MKIIEDFVREILIEDYGNEYQNVYDNCPLLQYLDSKMKAVHGDSKARKSLASIYAIYSILYFYQEEFYGDSEEYKKFIGYDFKFLFQFMRNLYGGSKLQNHALNSRVNNEFKNKLEICDKPLIIDNQGKYLIHIDYIYTNGHDISKTVCKVIEKYIELLKIKDRSFIEILKNLREINDFVDKKEKLSFLLTEDAEARIFEIISYSILKNHYKNISVFFGQTKETIDEVTLELFKTGRTNANDGGIDFVMKPTGRFFQVTEVNNYGKYLLDIDKVMHFPITFVIKTHDSKDSIIEELNNYIDSKSSGMEVLKNRYKNAVEEIITINELCEWTNELNAEDINNIIRDMDLYYRIEMNLEIEDDEY